MPRATQSKASATRYRSSRPAVLGLRHPGHHPSRRLCSGDGPTGIAGGLVDLAAIPDNHVVLRNRPDVVQDWSYEAVARRWWFLFPVRKDADGQPEDPTAVDLQMLTADEERLTDRWRRLSSLSWFMRCSPIGKLRSPQNPFRQCLARPRSGPHD